jgi:gliding motility-associated-like protein
MSEKRAFDSDLLYFYIIMIAMKKTTHTLSALALFLSLSFSAQTGKLQNSESTDLSKTEKALSETKVDFITNQNYLSKNSLKDYKTYYGDSLKGFDESGIKASLIGKNVFGEEYITYMKLLKREFINKKYQIGAAYTKKSSESILSNSLTGNSPMINGKPLGGTGTVNALPCVNEDFEQTAPGVYTAANAVNGWTIWSASASAGCNLNFSPGCSGNEFEILQTPILGFPTVGNIPHSPLGGTRVARLNNFTNNVSVTKLSQTFPVTNANNVFQFAFAGFWQNAGHNCPNCEQPGLFVRVLNCNQQQMTCSSVTLSVGCPSVGATFSTDASSNAWCNWQARSIDLTPYIGTCVTFEVWTQDCPFSGHWGSTVFDAQCGPQGLFPGLGGNGGNIPGPVSFCQGSGVAQIAAPLGYTSYQWIAPFTGTVPAPQGTMAVLTITNPVPGSVYTVNLTAPSGCQYVATNVITTSTVSIVGIGSTTTCAGGASGSATVQGNGSGAGYNYTWTAVSNNSVVSSASVATGLAPGVYNVVITGLGAAGCGSASATTTITTGPTVVQNLLKPFCGGQAYLNTTGGSNFQWYNGTTAITGSLGTASGYTVNSPQNLSVYRLRYTSIYGCNDSLQFTLVASPPGAMNVGNISFVCPGGSNGTAAVSMTPATGSPPGVNSFSITNLNTNTPSYNYSIYPTALNSVNLTGLSAGSYSVTTFDGSCKYNATFNVVAYNYNYTVTPVSPTLCPGNSIVASLTFTSPPSPTQFTYSWTPNTWIAGGLTNVASNIISPVVPAGTSSTVIYTIVVTPSVVNCPITKTLGITGVNPPTPTINPILPFCDNAPPVQILTTPMGGTFTATFTGTNNPIGNSSGIINPASSGLSLGINTFTYAIAVNTCIATQTANYEVSHYNPATLTTPTIAPLCVTNAPVNLMNLVTSAVNGTWTGTGVTGGGNAFSFVPTNLNTLNYVITYSTTSSPNPNTCPANSSMTVAVTKTIVPAISQVPAFCTNGAAINMTVNPGGGTWSHPAISPNGVITPSLATPSNSIASYVVNIGPCVNTNTTALIISQFNPATITGTVPNLCYNSSFFNLNGIVASTVNGTWSGPSVAQGSFDPTSPLITTGTYSLKYLRLPTPYNPICRDSSYINVYVLNPPAPVVTAAGPYCSKDAPIQMSVTPNSGSWTSSSYLSSTGMLTPSLCAVGNNAVQYIIGTSSCFRQQTKNISIEAFNPSTISSKLPDLCNTSAPINLAPFTLSGSGVWSGSGMSGTSFNPASVGAGNFVLTYQTASSPSGLCPSQSTVAVNVFSLSAPAITKPAIMCNNAKPLQLQVSPVGGLFGGANTNAVNIKGLFNPAAAVIGNNIINYSITSGPCVAYGQTTVEVVKFISADLGKYPKDVFCKGIDDPINMNSYAQNPGYTWSGTGIVPGSGMFNPALANIGINVITYSTNSTPPLCPDMNTVYIKVGGIPEVNVTTTRPNSGCAPLEAILTINSPTTLDGTASWLTGDGAEPIKDLTFTHVYNTPGTYTATLYYVSKDGCPAAPYTVDPTFEVYELPVSNFSIPDEIFISDPRVQLTNLTIQVEGNNYLWSVEGLYKEFPFKDIHPVVTFPKVGKYQVTLKAVSAHDCKSEITKTVEIKNDFNVFIPSSFSPNYDGLNDFFVPVFSSYGLDVKSFEMEVFDRWGHSVFRSKDSTKGWDGSLNNKGEPMKEEVYIYKIKFKDLDGNLYNKTGHVSLVK